MLGYTGCLVTVAKEMKIELGATSHMIYNSKIYKFVEFHDGAISVTIVTIFRTSHTDYLIDIKSPLTPELYVNIYIEMSRQALLYTAISALRPCHADVREINKTILGSQEN